MAKKKSAAKSIPVETHKHVADKRPNIPTRETAAFAKENGPQLFVVHRDRSLDPQLVWRGKDEQDAKPLEVTAVPIHVQEKVHPQAIVEDVKARAKQIKAFRDTWELGTHSYLSYLRDRLASARELLTESGSIFVQIGDENVHLVRCLLDEVFG